MALTHYPTFPTPPRGPHFLRKRRKGIQFHLEMSPFFFRSHGPGRERLFLPSIGVRSICEADKNASFGDWKPTWTFFAALSRRKVHRKSENGCLDIEEVFHGVQRSLAFFMPTSCSFRLPSRLNPAYTIRRRRRRRRYSRPNPKVGQAAGVRAHKNRKGEERARRGALGERERGEESCWDDGRNFAHTLSDGISV